MRTTGERRERRRWEAQTRNRAEELMWSSIVVDELMRSSSHIIDPGLTCYNNRLFFCFLLISASPLILLRGRISERVAPDFLLLTHSILLPPRITASLFLFPNHAITTGPRHHAESSRHSAEFGGRGNHHGGSSTSSSPSSSSAVFFNGSQTSHPTVALLAAPAGDAAVPQTSQLTFEAWIRPSSSSSGSPDDTISTTNRFIAQLAGEDAHAYHHVFLLI